jgi:hypothetical protein
MAKQVLTGAQKSIVNRYYANTDARVAGALQELVSDIALSEPGKAEKLWKKAGDLLVKCGVGGADLARSVDKKDVKALAEIVGMLISKPGELGHKPKPRV